MESSGYLADPIHANILHIHTYLPCLLGAELDERGAAHEEPKHVGHHVVNHHHQDRHNEPDQA